MLASDIPISPIEWTRHALVATGLVLVCLIASAEIGARLQAQNTPADQAHFLSSPLFLITHGQDLIFMGWAAFGCLAVALIMALRRGSGATIWGVTIFAFICNVTIVHALGDAYLSKRLSLLWGLGILTLVVHYIVGHLLRAPIEKLMDTTILKRPTHLANGVDVIRNIGTCLSATAILTIALYQLSWRLGRLQQNPRQGFLTNAVVTLHGNELTIVSWLAIGAIALAVILVWQQGSQLALTSIVLILGAYNLTLLNALGSDIMRTWLPRLWLISLLPLGLCLWANHRAPTYSPEPAYPPNQFTQPNPSPPPS